jgi:signal transduction histidine kinase
VTRQPATVPAESQQLPTRLLSATLAHELNNIVASLRGFVELGAEQARDHAALQRIFAEVRIGTDRAAALVAELEVLAATGGNTRPTPLRQCMATGAPDIQWECDGDTEVLVDPVQAQLASSLLRRIGGDRTAPALRVRLSADAAWLMQPLPPGRGRQPRRPGGSRQHLSTAEWRLAVLRHAAHAAGGHVLRQSEPNSLVLALPLA